MGGQVGKEAFSVSNTVDKIADGQLSPEQSDDILGIKIWSMDTFWPSHSTSRSSFLGNSWAYAQMSYVQMYPQDRIATSGLQGNSLDDDQI